MGLHTSIYQNQNDLIAAAEDVLSLCRQAKELEEAGEFNEARELLSPFWQAVGQRPLVDGLFDEAKAELLLRAGTLTGWLGSARQVEGAQEIAKDLISESASISERLGRTEKAAEATIDLAICYWREGALDEARVTLHHALDSLGELESEQRLRALLNTAIVEQVANRFDEALRIYRDAGPLFEQSTNHSLKGKFHNSYAIVLKGVGLARDSETYIDQALVEFAAARFHFEQAGHKRFRARVENNEGFVFARLGRFKEAHEHLNRARALHLSVGDHGGAAGVDDTRAQTYLLEGKNQDAEKLSRSAVRALEHGGEQSILAEALTTHGIALARLDQKPTARVVLERAISVALQAGDPDTGGIAALTMIEELGGTVQPHDLKDYFRQAESLLARSQHPRIELRLGEAARRVLVADENSAESLATDPNDFLPVAGYSLEAEVLRYEGSLIRKALEASGGSVTRAARLLGVTHQGLAFILNGRHSDLLAVRTPVKRRRKSIIKYR
jgi:tetratricopeptide (TPR) repeat protein